MKIKTSIVKNGGSFYAKIPPKIMQDLNLKEDDVVRLEIMKYYPTQMKVLSEFKQLNKTTTITYGDKEVTGEITGLDEKCVNLFSKEQDTNFLIPYSLITKIS